MTDDNELVKALRKVADYINCYECDMWGLGECDTERKSCVLYNAAAAIEKLQTYVKRLKECNNELREAQTYIDHYGDKWLTSAKDVPTAAYEHGYADGRNEAEAQLPKRGKWIKDEEKSRKHVEAIYTCSACHNFDAWGVTELYPYCPNCGAKMEVQDADN